MNSLASLKCGFSKCAVRLSQASWPITGLFLITGCGTAAAWSPPNNQGYSNGNLSGTYVFSSTGVDSTWRFLAVAGVFTADGSGTLSGGNIDVNGVEPVGSVFDRH